MLWMKMKILLRGNIYSYKIIRKYLLKQKGELVETDTDLCLEGFPRCGNTFAVSLLRKAYPSIKLGHHTHSIANLKIAIGLNIPVIVLIRNPLDAIVSFVLRGQVFSNDDIKTHVYKAVGYYEQFYCYVLKNRNMLHIVDFDTLINDTANFLCVVSHCNLKREIEFDEICLKNKINAVLMDLKSDEGKKYGDCRAVAVPDLRRDELKKDLKYRLGMEYKGLIDKLSVLYRKCLYDQNNFSE